MQLTRSQKGFTLVELLLATAVFSIALVAITAAIIQLFKAYQSGISIRKTQTSARLISEELTRAARASNAIAGDATSLCFFYKDSTSAGEDDVYSADRFYLEDGKVKKLNKQVSLPEGTLRCDVADFAGGSESTVSDDDVVVVDFDGSESSKKMMELELRVTTSSALETELQIIDGKKVCIPGYEYCSMTAINKSVFARTND